MAEYSTTLASFFAASINCGVIATGGGAWARAGEANTVPSANAVQPFNTSRLEIFFFFIASSLPGYRLSARQRSGGRKSQTSLPLATAFSVAVTIRNVVPSDVSTM